MERSNEIGLGNFGRSRSPRRDRPRRDADSRDDDDRKRRRDSNDRSKFVMFPKCFLVRLFDFLPSLLKIMYLLVTENGIEIEIATARGTGTGIEIEIRIKRKVPHGVHQ